VFVNKIALELTVQGGLGQRSLEIANLSAARLKLRTRTGELIREMAPHLDQRLHYQKLFQA